MLKKFNFKIELLTVHVTILQVGFYVILVSFKFSCNFFVLLRFHGMILTIFPQKNIEKISCEIAET